MSNNAGKYLDYLRDVVHRIRLHAAEAQGASGSDFDRGREFGLRQALAVLQSEAVSFELATDVILLEGFDPMIDPVDPPKPSPLAADESHRAVPGTPRRSR